MLTRPLEAFSELLFERFRDANQKIFDSASVELCFLLFRLRWQTKMNMKNHLNMSIQKRFLVQFHIKKTESHNEKSFFTSNHFLDSGWFTQFNVCL